MNAPMVPDGKPGVVGAPLARIRNLEAKIERLQGDLEAARRWEKLGREAGRIQFDADFLKSENDRLRAENAALQEQLTWITELDEDGDCAPGAMALKLAYALTKSEARVLSLIAERGKITHGALYDRLYGRRPACDQPSPEIVKVFMTKLRRKLKPHSLRIVTIWGEGFAIPDGDRAVVMAVMAPDGAETKATPGGKA